MGLQQKVERKQTAEMNKHDNLVSFVRVLLAL